MDMAPAMIAAEPGDRQTLCLPGKDPGVAIHAGEDGFSSYSRKHFPTAESVAIEKLLRLKAELGTSETEMFWTRLMEGMTDICNAQYGFVAKRILRDDHDIAIEMPDLGSEGSCLLGTAFYFNDGKDIKGMFRDYKYLALGAPCAHMKHDKVFLIPNNLQNFIIDNPNKLPFPQEAYIGIPLFSHGKCFAHFGLMWSPDGLRTLKLSWSIVELLMHSLEDLILDRLLRGESFAKTETQEQEKMKQVIPNDLITASQSLRPYARGLSHELRTPMQGVVGMLDVMHATVEEAIDGPNSGKMRKIFQDLRGNIEAIQDSSRRAVEAADNVVHAYDLNMDFPEPSQQDGPELRPSIFIEGNNTVSNPYKQKRRRSSPMSWRRGSSPKHRDTRDSPVPVSPRNPELNLDLADGVSSTDSETESSGRTDERRPSSDAGFPSTFRPRERDTYLPPSSKCSKIRDIFQLVIGDGLLVGGRPDYTSTEETALGQKYEIHSRSSNGEAAAKTITWSVEEDVPDVLPVDERDLSKLISCVFLNAFKFTEAGSIEMTAGMSDSQGCVLIKVIDTGVGIPLEFQPRLFKAFSREDDSLTRTKEGLGLGLLVAKGLSRKLGGDIRCVRSETSGPRRGTEFNIRIPLDAAEPIACVDSPFNGTSTPSKLLGHELRRHTLQTTPNGQTGNVPTSPLYPSPDSVRDGKSSKSSLAKVKRQDDHRRKSSTGASMLPPGLPKFDRNLAEKHPLTFLVAEDNRINRKLLVQMLGKLGYENVYEAFNGKEAVDIMRKIYESMERPTSPVKRTKSGMIKPGASAKPVDVILMDLWMPEMDGYEATKRIFELAEEQAKKPILKTPPPVPTVLAVTADATDEALLRATQTGMEGFMTKPYKLNDLQRLISEFSLRHCGGAA